MLIGISGKMKSGKNTVATMINKITGNMFVEYAFGDKLKQVSSIITGDDISAYMTQESKSVFLPTWNMTRREILQKVGTECMRNNLDKNVWIKSMFANINIQDDILISDVRLLNEAQAVKERGGILIRVNRPTAISNNNKGFNKMLNFFKKKEHISETGLDNYDGFDYIIDNNGSLDELQTKIVSILTTIGLEIKENKI